jgi:DNA-binding response OmpR family regulator
MRQPQGPTSGEPGTLGEPGEPSAAVPDRPGVLVVDDDPMLLPLLDTVLQRRGFRVWLASGGRDALDVYRRQQSQIGVVLLDVRMPDLDGPGTLAELRRLNPEVLCCFMSGHTGDYTEEELVSLGALCCFAKPFRVHEVAEALWRTARPPS